MGRKENLSHLDEAVYRDNTLNDLAQANGVPISQVYNHLRERVDKPLLQQIGYEHRKRGALAVIFERFGSQEWPENQQLRFLELMTDGPKHSKGRNKGNPDYGKIAETITREFPSYPRTAGAIKTRAKELRQK